MVMQKQKKRRDQGQPCPRRGRRYNQNQRRAVLAWEARHGIEAAANKFGVSTRTIQRWQISHPEDAKAAEAKSKRNPAAVEPNNAAKKSNRPKAQKAAAIRARHSRRYSVKEKKVILDAAAKDGVTEAAKNHGTSRWSIYEWQRRSAAASSAPERECALEPRSSRPKQNAHRLSEKRYHLIAETWKNNQALGPRQVRNQLRREHGIRVGTSTARKVMEEHGYVPPKVTVERRNVRRYEAVRPNQQVHLDFLHFFVHKAKVYLLLIEDDYSRFIVGWALCDGERSQPVIETVDEAISGTASPSRW